MPEMPEIGAPEHLNDSHNFADFDSGIPALDEWLEKRALANEAGGASRTYVVCASGRVVGYYALATGAIVREEAVGKVRRNMRDPIPVMVLGRLAVDKEYHGRGIGGGLLRDAIMRTVQAAAIGGIRAMLVHAISDEARRFYEHNGFSPSPVDPMTLMITIADARRLIGRT